MHDAGTGLWAAVLVFAGTCAGLALPPDATTDVAVDAMLVMGLFMAGGAWCLRGRAGWGWGLAMTLPLVIGFVSAGMEVQRHAPSEASGLPHRERTLVRCHVALLEPFRASDPADHDLLDRFQVDASRPSWVARAHLVCWQTDSGSIPAEGVVTVRTLSEAVHHQAGDVLACTGWLSPPQAASNPGQLDAMTLAWRRHWVGSIQRRA